MHKPAPTKSIVSYISIFRVRCRHCHWYNSQPGCRQQTVFEGFYFQVSYKSLPRTVGVNQTKGADYKVVIKNE